MCGGLLKQSLAAVAPTKAPLRLISELGKGAGVGSGLYDTNEPSAIKTARPASAKDIFFFIPANL